MTDWQKLLDRANKERAVRWVIWGVFCLAGLAILYHLF